MSSERKMSIHRVTMSMDPRRVWGGFGVRVGIWLGCWFAMEGVYTNMGCRMGIFLFIQKETKGTKV